MDEPEHDHHAVEATVVGVDPSLEPIQSVVVGDRRRMLGRRLGFLAIALLLMFFSIEGYIQSARNGRQLERAAKDRSALIQSLSAQEELIKQLQDAIRVQNKALKKAGIAIVPVPGDKTANPQPSSRVNQPSGAPTAGPAPPSSHPTPRPSSHPSPRPSPQPSPNPTEDVKDRVCRLTGICVSFRYRFTF